MCDFRTNRAACQCCQQHHQTATASDCSARHTSFRSNDDLGISSVTVFQRVSSLTCQSCNICWSHFSSFLEFLMKFFYDQNKIFFIHSHVCIWLQFIILFVVLMTKIRCKRSRINFHYEDDRAHCDSSRHWILIRVLSWDFSSNKNKEKERKGKRKKTNQRPGNLIFGTHNTSRKSKSY